MFDDSRAFVTRAFLRAEFDLEFRAWRTDGSDETLLRRLRDWDGRSKLTETQAEGAFVQTFFAETWGYGEAGRVAPEDQTLIPKLRIAGEGAGGGPGEADAALGWFRGDVEAIPQVLCEFKDIRSKLDQKQNRKGSNRSPVEQALNYVRGARRGLFGNEPVQPWWALVSDMNEVRLYWWDRAPAEYLRFVIRQPADLFAGRYDLLTDSEDARFDRFLFAKLFGRDLLLSPAGRPPLLRLVEKQWVRERKLEETFYENYRETRERMFRAMRLANPGFSGTSTDLLRLAQVLIDRFIFAFFCEDMGQRMQFPPQLVTDFLRDRSQEATFDANGDELWTFFRRLFATMNTGGALGARKVPHINGGLFDLDPKLDALAIPNHVFVAPGQGLNEANLESDRTTIFFLGARYNYAAQGEARESISLYTLGRIFEQSITELEYRAGEEEGRDTLAKLSKRKRDGVYYTPEWVVNLLVEETLGPWFAGAKAAAGHPAGDDAPPTPAAAEAYAARLERFRAVDPACGSGAFLISAFRRVLKERLAAAGEVARARGEVEPGAAAEAELIADVLARNIYGVDINPASVEIAKLALWLHSARPNAPLSSLDGTIRCGNSLVGDDFWQRGLSNEAARERVNSFDWRRAFPEVWPAGAEGGFDVVLGNPPYVKLQNLVRADPDVAAYLVADRGEDTYRSAQTGNFDLYLPFIEKGLRLLAPGGRMAFIAPSLWTVNDYGEGLRRLLRDRRQLDRWLDFKAHQIFREAITYTALQFFTREAGDAVRVASAPNGDAEAQGVDWGDAELAVPWDAMPAEGEWLMATGADRALIDRLTRDCLRLDDRRVTSGITVGIQTSADEIYHLERLGPGRYRRTPRKKPPEEVRIEDALMKPLVSGAEAKRYQAPETGTYLLFPYARDAAGRMRLVPAAEMARRFPSGWRYLQSFETALRGREKGKMDHADWHGYVYPKNLDKQDMVKLVVPRIVEHLKVSLDDAAVIHLDNVDVGGVLPARDVDPAFLLGVLNGPVADWMFRIVAKPFRGDYRSANKQFIAPLPVPDASPAEQADVAARARALQERHSRRRDLLRAASDRLSVLARNRRPARWLWPDLPTAEGIAAGAPAALTLPGERRDWAKARLAEAELARIDALQAALDGGGPPEAQFADGELRLYAGGAPALSRIFLSDREGVLVCAYWRFLLLGRDWRDAKSLASELRFAPAEADGPAVEQFRDRVAQLAAETTAIAAAESEMNELLYGLYGLTEPERELVENALAR